MPDGRIERTMQKIILLAALTVLIALAACSQATTAPEGTKAEVPTPVSTTEPIQAATLPPAETPAQIATAAPTAIPSTPEPAEAPEPTTAVPTPVFTPNIHSQTPTATASATTITAPDATKPSPTDESAPTKEHPLIGNARTAAAKHLGLDKDEASSLTLEAWESVTWPDGAIGCPQEGYIYTTAEVDGFIIHFNHEAGSATVHVNEWNGYAVVPSKCLPAHLPSGRPRPEGNLDLPEPEGTPQPATTLVITIAPIPPGVPEYSRSQWKHWTDEDRNCQDARQEVLVAESLVAVTYRSEKECRVETGRWYGAFSGTYVDVPGSLDVDDLVPLKNAHLSGGWT